MFPLLPSFSSPNSEMGWGKKSEALAWRCAGSLQWTNGRLGVLADDEGATLASPMEAGVDDSADGAWGLWIRSLDWRGSQQKGDDSSGGTGSWRGFVWNFGRRFLGSGGVREAVYRGHREAT